MNISVFNILMISQVFYSIIAFHFNQNTNKLVHTLHATKYNSLMPSDLNSMSRNRLSKYLAYSASSLITLYPILARCAIIEDTITRADVGFINLNESEPVITDTCWMDIKIADSLPQRIEIGLYGDVVPITANNFKNLCSNKYDYGYRGSEIFRIITSFSVQGGNIIRQSDLEGTGYTTNDVPSSRISRYGHSANGLPFTQENFRILHSYKDAGILSMMKDINNGGKQDSRFFITTEPAAGWADEKYVAFGRVTKGLDLVKGLSIIDVEPPSNYPKIKVSIIDSGIY